MVLDANGLAKQTLAFNPQVPTKRWNEALREFEDFVPPKPKIPAEEFFRRLTTTEREDIFDAARVPSMVNKNLYAFLETMHITSSLDPNDPSVIATVGAMEADGLIGPGRAVEVLA